MGAEKDNFTIRFDVRVIDVFEATSVVSFNVTVRIRSPHIKPHRFEKRYAIN